VDDYEGAASDVMSFTIIPPPPSVENPKVDEKGIRIRGRNLGEGITYHFQMSPDSEFKNILIDEKPDTPLITLQKPENTGIYFVRTSSIDAKGREGDFSLPQSFEIEHETPYGVLGIIGAFWLIIWLAF
jgi:hypothetical protein